MLSTLNLTIMGLERFMPVALAAVVGCTPMEIASVTIPQVAEEGTIPSTARSGAKKIIEPVVSPSSLNLEDLTLFELKTCAGKKDLAFSPACDAEVVACQKAQWQQIIDTYKGINANCAAVANDIDSPDVIFCLREVSNIRYMDDMPKACEGEVDKARQCFQKALQKSHNTCDDRDTKIFSSGFSY